MPRIDNLSDPSQEIRNFLRRLRALETASPLSHASIGRNGLRVYDGGVITVENGGLDVTGTAAVSGTLTVSGTETVTGTTNLNGPLNVSGATSLASNLTLTGGGKITAGAGTFSPTAAGGDPGLGSTASLGITAATSLTINAASILMFGAFSTSSISCVLPTTTSAANMFCSTLVGTFYRVTSASRYKIDPRPMRLSGALLDVPVKDWIDKGEHERDQISGRVPGVIAEEVEAAGGEAFVTYGEDGVIEGVAYDRLALARTQILADRLAETNEKLDRAMELIDAQETKITDLVKLVSSIVGLLERAPDLGA